MSATASRRPAGRRPSAPRAALGDPPDEVQRGQQLHRPEHPRRLELHRQGDAAIDQRQRGEEAGDQEQGANGHAALGRRAQAAAPPGSSGAGEDDRAEQVDRPGGRRPFRRERVVLGGHERPPSGVHHGEIEWPAAAPRAAAHQQAGHRGHGRQRQPRLRLGGEHAGADDHHEARRGRRMQRRARRRQSQGPPGPAVQQQPDAHQPQPADEHPRMEVALERVHAGLRDAVAQRQGGDPRRHGPAGGQHGPPDQHGAAVDRGQRHRLAGSGTTPAAASPWPAPGRRRSRRTGRTGPARRSSASRADTATGRGGAARRGCRTPDPTRRSGSRWR